MNNDATIRMPLLGAKAGDACESAVCGEDWARQAQAGSLRAFEELVRLHHRRVYNFLWQFARNQHDAEDLTQQTFVKAWQGMRRFDPRYSFATWLFTIARRTAISHLRKKREIEELPDELPADARTDERAEDLWTVARAKLKPKQFEALWLTYGEDFSNAQVARVMGTNVIYVKVLLHRARAELKRHLERRTQQP